MALQIEQGSYKYLNVYLTSGGTPATGLSASAVTVQYQKQGQASLTTKVLESLETTVALSFSGNDSTAFVADSSIFPSTFGRIVIGPGTTNEETFEVSRNIVSSGQLTLSAIEQPYPVVVGSTDVTGNTLTSLVQTGASWVVDEFAGKYVRITVGNAINQVRKIVSNTSEVLTLATEFAASPADVNGVTFEIITNSFTSFTAEPGSSTSIVYLPSSIESADDDLTNMVLAIVEGTGAGERRVVASNTVSTATPITPFLQLDSTSVIQIQSNKVHTAGDTVRLLDWQEVGNGIYSILFQSSELDTPDAFTYFVTGTFDTVTPIQVDIHPIGGITAGTDSAGTPILLCRVEGNIRSVTGEPQEGVYVGARIIGPPQLVSNRGLASGLATAKTDSTGQFELALMRGAIVEFVISAIQYRRVITVPDQDRVDIFQIP